MGCVLAGQDGKWGPDGTVFVVTHQNGFTSLISGEAPESGRDAGSGFRVCGFQLSELGIGLRVV